MGVWWNSGSSSNSWGRGAHLLLLSTCPPDLPSLLSAVFTCRCPHQSRELCSEPETVFWWRENGGKQVDAGWMLYRWRSTFVPPGLCVTGGPRCGIYVSLWVTLSKSHKFSDLSTLYLFLIFISLYLTSSDFIKNSLGANLATKKTTRNEI